MLSRLVDLTHLLECVFEGTAGVDRARVCRGLLCASCSMGHMLCADDAGIVLRLLREGWGVVVEAFQTFAFAVSEKKMETLF